MKKIEQKIQQLETTILESHVLKEKNLFQLRRACVDGSTPIEMDRHCDTM